MTKPTIELRSPTAVVCHDAGAANHILAWLADQPDHPVLPYMMGPARELWFRRFPALPLATGLDEAIRQSRSVLTGTGWASNVEHEARKLARKHSCYCVAVIDHWTNYPQRFERDGEKILPDEIWVTDEIASGLARRCFPETPIVTKPNRYLAGEIAHIAALPAGQDILYLCEPVRSNWGRDEPGEFQALDYFMASLDVLALPHDASIALRMHPSEPAGKYDAKLRQYRRLRLDPNVQLAQSIANARWVVGLQSFAMVIALAAGRTVMSSLPPWAPECRLPHPAIIQLRHHPDARRCHTPV